MTQFNSAASPCKNKKESHIHVKYSGGTGRSYPYPLQKGEIGGLKAVVSLSHLGSPAGQMSNSKAQVFVFVFSLLSLVLEKILARLNLEIVYLYP